MTEAELLKRLMQAVSKVGTRIFRNHVGMAYQGEPIRVSQERTVTMRPGDVLIRSARTVHAGLCVGSSDLVGWTPHTIAAHDVGRTVAVFTSIEAKAEHGRLTAEQLNFLDQVARAGGIAIEARDVDKTVAQINEQRTGKS